MWEYAEDYLDDITNEEKAILEERLNKVWKEFKRVQSWSKLFTVINDKNMNLIFIQKNLKILQGGKLMEGKKRCLTDQNIVKIMIPKKAMIYFCHKIEEFVEYDQAICEDFNEKYRRWFSWRRVIIIQK